MGFSLLFEGNRMQHLSNCHDHIAYCQTDWEACYTSLITGSVVGEHLEDIIPVFIANLNPDKDPEVRLKFFTSLSKLMMDAGSTVDSQGTFGEYGVTVVEKMILPNCTWRAGRVAGAIRTTAVSCLWALLQSGVLTKQRVRCRLVHSI